MPTLDSVYHSYLPVHFYVCLCHQSLQLASEAISASHPLRPCVDTVLEKVPADLQQRMRRRQRAGDAAPMPTQKSLVALHRQVIRALQHHHRTEAQWEMLIDEVGPAGRLSRRSFRSILPFLLESLAS